MPSPNTEILYLNVMNDLKRKILSNEFMTSCKIPSRNELAFFYGVNSATVSRGIDKLISNGILFKRTGRGTYVSEHAISIIEDLDKKNVISAIVDVCDEAKRIGMTKRDVISFIDMAEG